MKLKLKMLPAVLLSALALGAGAARAGDQPGRQLSPSLRPVEDTPGLPRVFLIGDSISMGYTLGVRQELAGRANVHRPPTNCGSSASGRQNIKKWLGAGKWDVIHFNFGLHDMKYLKPGRQNVPPDRYEHNLQDIVKQLKATGATLVFATTTPVPEAVKNAIYERIPADVGRYNEIALRVMKEHGVRIDDLHAVAKSNIAEYQIPNDVHFNKNGNAAFARAVAASVLAALESGAAGGAGAGLEGAGGRAPRGPEADEDKPAAPRADDTPRAAAAPRADAAPRTAAGAPRVAGVEPRVWRCDFDSEALGRPMRFMVVLPEGVTPETKTRRPVIYFLHGRGRNERTLLQDGACRARLLASPCAIVLPYAREGWYINSPVQAEERHADYIDEVVALSARLFPLGDAAGARAIGGWSMGGYGAMYTAVRRPGDFAAVATIIGLLDFPEPKEVNGGYAVPPRFGGEPAGWAERNPIRRVRALRGGPAVRVAYATRAPETGMNRRFIAAAEAAGVAVEVESIDGGHTFPVVQALLPGTLAFLEQALRGAPAGAAQSGAASQ
ncbi:MAG: GDSL-type esterase/lipase family protein [Opitutaceae bacterium]|jgi:acyl-CoA thioesterase-1|nr:GDSL-type esterase/lipase family protein [Opitutaceae bacterium]